MFKIKYAFWFIELIWWCLIDFFKYKNKKELINDKWEEYKLKIELDNDDFFKERLKQNLENYERYN